MAKSLKLIVETPQYDSQDYDFITESDASTGTQHLYIKGPFTEAEARNRNKRIYPLQMMVEEINSFNTNYIQPKRATGELEHPEYPHLDASKACHLITEIKQDGNIFYGKSKVLSTPSGKILEALIKDGVQLGISSRSLGNVNEGGVVSDLKLCTFDVVSDPSCQKAFVNGILESKNWICNNDGDFEEAYDKFEKSLQKLPKLDLDRYLCEQVCSFIKNLNK